jgi:hypothetical protein
VTYPQTKEKMKSPRKPEKAIFCHSCASRNPVFKELKIPWIPVFTGMTTFYETIKDEIDKLKNC